MVGEKAHIAWRPIDFRDESGIVVIAYRVAGESEHIGGFLDGILRGAVGQSFKRIGGFLCFHEYLPFRRIIRACFRFSGNPFHCIPVMRFHRPKSLDACFIFSLTGTPNGQRFSHAPQAIHSDAW